MASTRVISIGYEGRTPAELIAALVAAGVTKVVDVRELPLSRRKGFSKTPLSEALARAGIVYRHLRAAGNPHRHLKDDPTLCLDLYGKHLQQHPEIVQQVASECDGDVALLCFERHHADCHRSRLIEALTAVRRARRELEIVRLE